MKTILNKNCTPKVICLTFGVQFNSIKMAEGGGV